MRLPDLLDMALLEKLAEANYRATGMPIGIVDAADGAVLVGSGWQDVCVLFHRVNPISAARCRESDDFIKQHATDCAPCEYRCKNGLRDIGMAIRVEGEHVATLFLGQFFYEGEAPDLAFFTEQARQLGLDEAPYLAAVRKVPIFSRASVENIIAYDLALARFVAELAEAALRRRRAEADAEALARFPRENPDPVLRLDTELTVVYANDAAVTALRALGVAAGRPAPPRLAALARRALAEPKRIEEEIPADDRVFSMTARASGDEVNVYAHDITSHVRAEKALRERDDRLLGAMQRLESLLENSPLAVLEWSPDEFRVSRWSDEAARVFGWSAEEAVGKGIGELGFVHPDDRAGIEQVKDDMLGGGRSRNVARSRNVRKDGSIIHCEWYNSTVRDASGEVASVLSLVLDVTERERAEQALREASRRKDEFLGMLSHELRNPLAPIRTSLYILDHADPAGPQARRAKEIANRQVAHLTRVVDDLLDVTRIARGKIELRSSRLDLADVARRTGEDYRAVMQERGIRFATHTPEGPIWVHGDETRLAQVIGNLLQNAAKFTPAGGQVTLSVAVAGDDVEVSVRDTGAGVDPGLGDEIFLPFVQAKQSLARTEGGLGLGLALVKGLIELHGGAVAVESGGRDRGSLFTLRIPRLPAGAPALERPPTDAGLARANVLVVDDNHDAAESLAELVRVLGYTADVAFDGPTAIANVGARPPDLVLCDVGLPGMSGYEVAQALRSDQRLAGVRLVAVTGYAQPEDRQRAFDAGFEHHIAKPADPRQLEQLLARSLAAAPAKGARAVARRPS